MGGVNEVASHLAETYRRLPVGGRAWVRPDDTTSLNQFQLVAAAAKMMQALGRIDILETKEDTEGDARLVGAIHFRRLK